MALLDENPGLDLYDSNWIIHTRSEERPPVKCLPPGELIKSMASNGCVISGTVINSVLSPGVRVEKGATVRNSVIMNDTVVRAGATIDSCILDKSIEVGANAQLGAGKDDTPNQLEPNNINTGITIVGKRASIPAGAVIGRNCRIDPGTTEADYPALEVPSGGSIVKKLGAFYDPTRRNPCLAGPARPPARSRPAAHARPVRRRPRSASSASPCAWAISCSISPRTASPPKPCPCSCISPARRTWRKWIEAMFTGQKINNTEGRAVLHVALRNRSNTPIYVDDQDVMPEVNRVLAKMRSFSEAVRSGEWKGYTGKPITDIVNIGIGGSDLGPKMVCEALKPYARPGLRAHFVSNVDSTDLVETLKALDPETVLFLVASKTFTTQETMTNAHSARRWFLEAARDESAVAKHFAAMSTNSAEVSKFGIDTRNMFEFWDWVGGRYSLWSAIGLSIALYLGMDRFEELLAGAHQVDQHFRTAPFEQQHPRADGLARHLVRQLLRRRLPRHPALRPVPAALLVLFPAGRHGKQRQGRHPPRRVAELQHRSGHLGTARHQRSARLLPAHPPGHPAHPLRLPRRRPQPEPARRPSPHPALQLPGPDRSADEGQDPRRSARRAESPRASAVSGSKSWCPPRPSPATAPPTPSSTRRLTPSVLGALVACYEHKIFTQGVIWNINSYDQWGVELGKQLAKQILPELTSPGPVSSHDSSTNGLINAIKSLPIIPLLNIEVVDCSPPLLHLIISENYKITGEACFFIMNSTSFP